MHQEQKTTTMRAVIYARTSSSGAVESRQNTDSQVAKVMEYVMTNNIEVVKVFEEHISGAKKNKDRAVLNECLEYAKTNNIDIILFNSLDRLGRSILEIQKLLSEFSENKINAYFVQQKLSVLNEKGGIDPMTIMCITCLGFVAELERENIKYRLNRGREYAKNNGVKMGRKVGTKMTKADREKKYKKVIELLRKGLKVKDIQSICKEQGIKCGVATINNLKAEFCK